MDTNQTFNLSLIPSDPKVATKTLTEFLFNNVYPLMLNIRSRLQKYDGSLAADDISKLQDVYALCSSQIKKTLLTLFGVFKTEYHSHISMQDSRQCTLERLSWCVTKLMNILKKLENSSIQNQDESVNDSMMVTPMYFVNWIDHTFEILSKLSEVIYRTDYKNTNELYGQWKNDVVECVSTLHLSLDELLLSAMTLCKYCLPSDQHIVKARCQVVLRESKALISELVQGDLDKGFKVTPESLKLPIMPSNVNVLIDVLKDVLYVLETNTNTALLALVIHCFSYSTSPVEVLKQHFLNSNGTCACHMKGDEDVTEDCSFVKEFDLYNERLLQIGSFAVSCSSDQGRILCLRSGLASLEALDPHLVPALMLSAQSYHASMLVDSWSQEVREIRDSIFLIVDPAAFAEKTKQMMHQLLLDLMQKSTYSNSGVCAVINIGCVVLELFQVYNKLEPEALTQHDTLVPLLDDLHKVQMECKVVSNLLSKEDDYVFDVKKSKTNKQVSLEQLMKRLRLLYTLVGRINSLLHPKENEELFDEAEEEVPIRNVTHTVRKNMNTYVQSPRKLANISRSIFARTTNIRSSTNKFPLQKLTQHLRDKKRDEFSFSIQLDELFNLSEVKGDRTGKHLANKQLDSIRESAILYNFSPKKRGSLRKAVLSRHCKVPFDIELRKSDEKVETSRSGNESLMDEATSLQITDILNDMTGMTRAFSKMRVQSDATFTETKHDVSTITAKPNVLRININSENSIAKPFWNIPVNSTIDDTTSSNTTGVSNITAPSNVTTLERITDLEFLENKLNNLKNMEETSL
ncbi:hypothetical protein O0L34_g418 [Tuta absoluta]|nr:hypothetical protein O0L34_g418 [Tuta absoluta]